MVEVHWSSEFATDTEVVQKKYKLVGDTTRVAGQFLLANEVIQKTKVFQPSYVTDIVDMVHVGTLSNTLAKTVLEEAFESGKSPSQIVREKGLSQISDTSVVEEAVRKAISENPKAVEDYMKGKDTASKFLVGQVMRLTKGKGNPAVVNELVKEGLEALKSS